MDKNKIFICFSSFLDKATLTSFIKYNALDRKDIIFFIRCSDAEFVSFSGFENIVKVNDDFANDVDVELTFNENEKNCLIGFDFNNKKTNSLVFLDENMDSLTLETYLKEALALSAIFINNLNGYYSFSHCLESKINSKDIFIDIKEENIKELFKKKDSFLLISYKDFSFLENVINGYLDSFSNLDSPGIFSSIGSFFFKNYMPSKQIPPFSSLMTDYRVLLGKKNLTISISKDLSFSNYQDLFNKVMNLIKARKENV